MQRFQRRICAALLLIVILLSLTGCWSSKEIEDLSVFVAVALDVGKESKTDKELAQKGGSYLKKNLVTMTLQIVTPQAAGSGTKTGTQLQKQYVNTSETGDSIIQIIRQFAIRRERPVVGHHLKVIVISSELARKYKLEQLLDFFLRDNNIRPSCLVLISKGKASAVLESKEAGEIPAFHLTGMVDNQFRTLKILPYMSLALVESKIQSDSSFLLQNVISTKNEVKFAGAAVFKSNTKNKHISTFDEEDLEGITWISGKGKGGIIKSYNKKTGKLVAYEVKSMKSKITPHLNGKDLSFTLTIESKGRLIENWDSLNQQPTNNAYLQEMEHTSEQEVKRLIHNVITKMQKQYKVDVAGFGNRLRIKYPKAWKKYRKNWDETFSKLPITYKVNLTITEYGASTGGKKEDK